MHLTTGEIEYKLENIERCSIKDIVDIIIDMSERIDYLERAYISLSMDYDKLKALHKKHHLNSMYGLMVTESSKGE